MLTLFLFNQLLQEVEEAGQKEAEETEISKGREEEDCSNEEGPKTENPLDKYMKIILEARKKQTEVGVEKLWLTLWFF